jgi:beta-1,4-mannooligosaccharide/beta-1,4-mannosyl-N-acetylglucosamine phosphorylase
MIKMKIAVGESLKNISWEERPESSSDIIWRYLKNPVISCANSIFNSVVVPFGKYPLLSSANS